MHRAFPGMERGPVLVSGKGTPLSPIAFREGRGGSLGPFVIVLRVGEVEVDIPVGPFAIRSARGPLK